MGAQSSTEVPHNPPRSGIFQPAEIRPKRMLYYAGLQGVLRGLQLRPSAPGALVDDGGHLRRARGALSFGARGRKEEEGGRRKEQGARCAGARSLCLGRSAAGGRATRDNTQMFANRCRRALLSSTARKRALTRLRGAAGSLSPGNFQEPILKVRVEKTESLTTDEHCSGWRAPRLTEGGACVHFRHEYYVK